MYAVVLSGRVRKSLHKYGRSGSFPQEKFRQAIMCLRQGNKLPQSYKDHALKGELGVYREFHLGYDLLVQYKRNEEKRVITLSNIGTHTELFGG